MQKEIEKMFFVSEIIASELGCLKLSLLIREYLSSPVNMLRNILKTLHITKIHFFQLNCLHSDQYIM